MVMPPGPGVYVGSIRHRRHAPRAHEFRYALFMVLLDIDRIPECMAASRFTSYNRFNWAAFDERDHLDGDPSRHLRERLRDAAAAAGETLPDGPVYLLTNLRYLGYVFNPISIYYCYGRDGGLALVLAEVNNTYGGRRYYWLHPADDETRRFRSTAAKAMYVSPFMEYDVDYEFVLTPPSDSLVAHMNVLRGAGSTRRMFDATLSLDRQPWTAQSIRSALVRFPWMTAKVIAAIHWEALRLWIKGVPVMPFPQEHS
jgi:uncharacterized protein